jgi:hypothetical protein
MSEREGLRLGHYCCGDVEEREVCQGQEKRAAFFKNSYSMGIKLRSPAFPYFVALLRLGPPVYSM